MPEPIPASTLSTAPLQVVILAAGRGTRMRSARPKVLQPLAGRALLAHVLDTAEALQAQRRVVVVGHGAGQVREQFAKLEAEGVALCLQEPQLGTGHAVLQAVPHLDADAIALVLYGDVPLVRPATLQPLLAAASRGALALLTVNLPDPQGYGRIVRDSQGRVLRIVEQRDATPDELAIHEVNTGILAAPVRLLAPWVAGLGNDNAQGEYYLTDVVACATAAGTPVQAVIAADAHETLGVNDRTQLAALERIVQRRTADALLESGVTLADPARIDVRGSLRCGSDVWIDVGCVFEGRVELGDGVSVGPNCVLRDCTIGAGSRLEAFTHVDGARCGEGNRLGPFARLRPGSELDAGVHVGNFTEIKNSTFGRDSKANHLSYVGDATVGARVNIGAGTVTCNYDGVNKHPTIIGDGVFIGSGNMLVAPLTIGVGSYTAAGSTINQNVPPDSLAIGRSRQTTKVGWARERNKNKGIDKK